MLRKSFFALIMSVLLIGIVSGCTQSTSKEEGKGTGKQTVKIGYFPNLTHSATIIALEKGFLKKSSVKMLRLKPKQWLMVGYLWKQWLQTLLMSEQLGLVHYLTFTLKTRNTT